jgi:hypothetical protein
MNKLFIKESEIGKVIIGQTPEEMKEWRAKGIGPEYKIMDNRVYYKLSTLEKFFTQNKVETKPL